MDYGFTRTTSSSASTSWRWDNRFILAISIRSSFIIITGRWTSTFLSCHIFILIRCRFSNFTTRLLFHLIRFLLFSMIFLICFSRVRWFLWREFFVLMCSMIASSMITAASWLTLILIALFVAISRSVVVSTLHILTLMRWRLCFVGCLIKYCVRMMTYTFSKFSSTSVSSAPSSLDAIVISSPVSSLLTTPLSELLSTTISTTTAACWASLSSVWRSCFIYYCTVTACLFVFCHLVGW